MAYLFLIEDVEMSGDGSTVICFDMEMCCWHGSDKKLGEIISFGLCELDLATGVIGREFHHYVQPDKDDVSEFCTSLTGITPRMVDRQGKSLAAVMSMVAKRFGSRKPYVAWGDDANILNRECGTKGIESPVIVSIDVGLLYKLRRRRAKNVGLAQALHAAGEEFEGQAHNALVDAKNLATLIVKANLL